MSRIFLYSLYLSYRLRFIERLSVSMLLDIDWSFGGLINLGHFKQTVSADVNSAYIERKKKSEDMIDLVTNQSH